MALLQEWCADIGATAGLTPFNATINSGAIGVPESRLEVRPAPAVWLALCLEYTLRRHTTWPRNFRLHCLELIFARDADTFRFYP